MSDTSYHIGISGWTYAPWRKVFYPEGLTQKNELAYASRQFNSIEINGTFYGLQKPPSFRRWYDETPDNFVFSLKGSRYITHIRRLKEVDEPLSRLFGSGLLLLKEKLGPILWQFPPSFKYDKGRLESFFEKLPRSFSEAQRLGKQRMTKEMRPWADRPLHHVIEIRHDSFKIPEFVELLRHYNISLVFADTVEWPYHEDVTGDVIYARLHGSEQLYVSGYSEDALDRWAKRFALWRQGKEPRDALRLHPKKGVSKPRDVYVYFDNDAKVRAPFDAMALAKRLDVKQPQPDLSVLQNRRV